MFVAECPRCKEKVSAATADLSGADLKTALGNDAEVRVVHLTPNDGDHVWTLSKQDKKNLRSAIEKGLVKI